MEYKQISISLEEPLLNQQSVREFLNLSAEKANPKIRINDLLEVAKVVIRNELASRGYSEDELNKLRLTFQKEQEESQEIHTYSVEWKPVPKLQVKEKEPEANLNKDSPISVEFTDNLNQRLNELMVDSDTDGLTDSNINISFRTLSSSDCQWKWAEHGNVFCWAKVCGDRVVKWKEDSLGNKVCIEPDFLPTDLT